HILLSLPSLSVESLHQSVFFRLSPQAGRARPDETAWRRGTWVAALAIVLRATRIPAMNELTSVMSCPEIKRGQAASRGTGDDARKTRPGGPGESAGPASVLVLRPRFSVDGSAAGGSEPHVEPCARTLCCRSDRAGAMGHLGLSDRGGLTRCGRAADHRNARRGDAG